MTDPDLPPPPLRPPLQERRNFYGRIHGKTMRASQKDYTAGP